MSSIEIKVPLLPESVADATVLTWHKKPGDKVERDENLVDLETDKVVLEVLAPDDGVLEDVAKSEGTNVLAEELLGKLNTNLEAASKVSAPKAEQPIEVKKDTVKSDSAQSAAGADLTPAVRRLVAEHGINLGAIKGTGKSGRVVKEDVMKAIEEKEAAPDKLKALKVEKSAKIQAKAEAKPEVKSEAKAKPAKAPMAPVKAGDRVEERVPMTRLRSRIAERLVQAQQETAMLTTFNEVNLQAIIDIRKQHKDAFEKRHGVRLGFMSFFTKAVVEALKRFPDVNASIDGKDVIYHGYYDVGIAISSPRGLVVPILRNADQMGLADVEGAIGEYAGKAKAGQLTIEEMTGGTFTITNGGVFGSMLSTPILNPPQSAILGMHKIQERAVVENGEVVVRPMMYLALSYDHRIIDGKQSVSFLVAIKDFLEDPSRLLLDV